MKNIPHILAACILAQGLLTGCDETKTKIQYMPDMADAPTVKAQEDYLNPPEGSVAITSIPYGSTPEENAQYMTNPVPSTEGSVSQGEKLFNTFCTVCHGKDGKGKGTITDEFPQPPDITADVYKQKPDSFFFYRISTGGAAFMPSYAHAIDLKERWMIVNYLRKLQGVQK